MGWCLSILAFPLMGWSQPRPHWDLQLQVAASATGNGNAIHTGGLTTVGIGFKGTGGGLSATVALEVTQNLTDWVAVTCTNIEDQSTATSVTVTGTTAQVWTCPVAGVKQLRARISAISGGTLTVTATAQEFSSKAGTGAAGASGITGATANAQLYATGATTATSGAALTTGQVLVGATGAAPGAGTLPNIAGIAVDAQIPDLSGLSTGLTGSRCVETTAGGALTVAAGTCGTGAAVTTGTALPGTCTVGALFIDTDAAASGKLYSCYATNTWDVAGGSTATHVTATEAFTGTGTVLLSSGPGQDAYDSGVVLGTVADLTGPQVLNQTGTTPRITTVSDAATTLAIDVSTTDLLVIDNITTAGLTFTKMGTAPDNGKILRVKVRDAASSTLSWPADFKGDSTHGFGFSLPATTTGGADLWEEFAFEYNTKPASPEWQLLSTTQVVSQNGSKDLTPNSVKFPASDPATLDNSETNSRLLFDNVTSQCIFWQFTVPTDYIGTPAFQYIYSMTSVTTGSHHMDISVMVQTDDDLDVNTESYDTANNCNDTAVPAQAGDTNTITCSLTTNDSMVAGKYTKIKMCRDTANDDAAGVSEVISGLFKYVR